MTNFKSTKTKSLIGIAAVAVGAGLVLSGCGGNSTPEPGPTETSSSSSPTSATPTPTFDGTVYNITDDARAKVGDQLYSSKSGVITVSSDNTKIHVYAEGSTGFTLDLVVNSKGQATSGTLRPNNSGGAGSGYNVDKGGAIEFGGLQDTVLIGTTKDIPVTPEGANGSLAMSLDLAGKKQ
ncbi:MAG: hypothetical protein WAS05_05735 [Candidatus Nanopelagicales bacterium]